MPGTKNINKVIGVAAVSSIVERSHNFLAHSGKLFVKGLFVGLVVVLPGMSGGTLILILGLYEILMRDLSRFRILPWLPFVFGLAGGMLISGRIFSWFFSSYTNFIMGFLLGCILASIRSVLGEKVTFSYKKLVFLVIGLISGFLLSGSANLSIGSSVQPNLLFVFLIAALSSAAMILPGVPGSSVLIIAGIYDNVMHALASLDWPVLLVFAAGGVVGAFALANIFNKLYTRYRAVLSWTFAGLIIGSGRMLIPSSFDRPLIYIVLCITGFALTWLWESRTKKVKIPASRLSD